MREEREGRQDGGCYKTSYHPVTRTIPLGKFLVKFENICPKTRSQNGSYLWRPAQTQKEFEGARSVLRLDLGGGHGDVPKCLNY